MPCETKSRFVVLYGSQKGQAQSIAEGIAEEAEDHGLVAELSCLNQDEKVASTHISRSHSFHLEKFYFFSNNNPSFCADCVFVSSWI